METDNGVRIIKGDASHQDEFMDLINYVFHMNGREDDFYRLLPKLYKKEYNPCQYNYMVMEDERIKGAVGSYPGEVNICGETLRFIGIGNVAVHPYASSKGYMKLLMNTALKGMQDSDVDFSVLAGRRNRYAYFSYEIAGRKFKFWLDEANIRHRFGKDKKERYMFTLLKEDNREALKNILALQRQEPFYYTREEDKLYDILKNWPQADTYLVYEGESFKGYLIIYNNETIKEILLEKDADIAEVSADFHNKVVKKELEIEIAAYQKSYLQILSGLAESLIVEDKDNFTVFHYDKVIKALLTLKSRQEKVADGEIIIHIAGIKRDENLKITVMNQEVQVIQTTEEAAFSFNHLEAMSLFFGNYSPLREVLPILVQSWLPLPLYIFPADEV